MGKSKKKKRTPTEQMIEAVSRAEPAACPNFPASFLCGLRGALDAGLSAEEITALLVLFAGVHEATSSLPRTELIRRAHLLADTMRGDILDQADRKGRMADDRRLREKEREEVRREKIETKLRKLEEEEEESIREK